MFDKISCQIAKNLMLFGDIFKTFHEFFLCSRFPQILRDLSIFNGLFCLLR